MMVLRRRLEQEIKTLDETIADIEAHGVQSFTISTGDGQQSKSNIDLDKLIARREAAQKQLAAVNRTMRGAPALKIIHRMTVRS